MDLGLEFKRRDFSGGSGFMSVNQSKSDKNESQYRKPGGGNRSGSSGQPRTFASSVKGGGGGSTAPPLVTNPPSQSATRSNKKIQNAQGVQPRVIAGSVNAAIAAPAQNGSHSQSTQPGVTYKPNDTATQRNTVPIPRGPSQSSALKSDSTAKPINPAKGDGAKGYSLQFGSISPGFMNGVQVPARTTSAPPNIDELKRDQLQHAASKAAAVIPAASVPKPQPQGPRKDVVPVPQHITGESNKEIKVKRDAPVMPAHPASQAQKLAVLPHTGNPMQGHYPQQSMMQFGGPNPQMQSQGMPSSSPQIPLQMPLQMQQQQQQQQHMYLQHAMMQQQQQQAQGIMHQSQNLGFNPQMSQLPHQMANPGMNLAPQYAPQQPANYSNTRKTVKITHPETHEELRLDKKIDVPADATSAQRTHHNVQQPPPYPSSHPMGYYAAVPPYFSAAPSSSLPLGSAQLNPIPQQASRFTYPASQAPQAGPFVSRAGPNVMPVSKGGTVVYNTVDSYNLDLDSFRVTHNVVSSSPASVTIKPATSSSTGKRMDSKPVEKGEAPRISRPAAEMSSTHHQKETQINPDNNMALPKFGSEQLKPSSASIHENVANKTASSTSAVSHGNSSTVVNYDRTMAEPMAGSESVKENQNKSVNKGHDQSLPPQFGMQASTGLSQDVEGGDDSRKMLSSLPVEAKKDISGSGAGLGTVQPHLEQSSAVGVAPIDDGSSGADIALESPACDASQIVGASNSIVTAVDHPAEQQDPPQAETSGTGKTGEKENLDGEKQKSSVLDIDSAKPAVIVEKSNAGAELEGNNFGTGHAVGDMTDIKISSSEQCIRSVSDDGIAMKASDCPSVSEEVSEVHSSGHEGEAIIVPVKAAEAISSTERQSMETARPTSSSGSVSSSDKGSVDSNKTKTTAARGKKKIKQLLQKADAQGTTSDLYLAYKGPDEKKDGSLSVEQLDDTSSTELKLAAGELNQEDDSQKDKDDESKAEPDDWEDAADASTPKLQSTSNDGGELARQGGEEAEFAKKYSRDFLLTFSEQYTDLPNGFEITSDISDILTRPNSSSSLVGDREFPSPGRIADRPSSGHKADRRGSGVMDSDRWNKNPGPLPSPREMGLDSGYGSTPMGFRPGHGGNPGVLRNPRAQTPVQYPLLSGPMHSIQRNNADNDRWRSINIKGLMPPPQAHMHKAERKYQVGKVTDEEQAKQRKLKGILNKLTPQNFEKLFAQVKEVNIDNVMTLTGVISQIFDKALMEPTFCEMYSNFCSELSTVLPELIEGDEKFTFKRLLLNKCQEEFERGEREEEEASKADGVEETKLSDAEREERRVKARRRMLGNIRLIGELFKKRMLTERIMHACISTLFGKYPHSVEEDIESLCKLMSTIGEMIDHTKAKHQIDIYFEMMAYLSNSPELSSRVRFMLKDAIDLRKNKWQTRMKVEGPKKIEDVHRDAAQERHAQATRLNRGPSMGPATRRGQPVDFGPRGSGMLSSPVGQTGSFRGLPQGRGYAMQDARIDERNSFNSRNISVTLPQRPLGGDSITLGPQGGLARGMSIKGQSSVSAAPLADNSLSRGPNGFNSIGDRGSFNSRKDPNHRYTPTERFGVSQLSTQDHKNVDQNLDRSIPASTPSRGQGVLTGGQNMSSDKVWPEERLREKSIATIREFYSAKDEKEVDICVRELNAPKCYPSVISFWVTDSFDRKDLERNLLNTLIVNLSKTRDGQLLFTPDQLIKGFEAVLTNLEDTVNDAPKAPDYLGRLFAKLIAENILSLQEIGGLLYEGGEEPGRLRKEGLAGDVLGSILENIQAEKGDDAVKELRASSKLRLEDFRPPDPVKSKKLELFI